MLTQQPDSRLPRLLSILNDPKQAATARRQAAYLLGEVKAPAARPDLEKALAADADVEVRSRAAAAVGKIGPADAALAAVLVAAIDRDAAWQVRHAAAEALERSGAARHAVPRLAELLRTDSASQVRAAAAKALRHAVAADRTVLEGLETALKDADLRVRLEAAGTLGVLAPRADAAVPVLIAVLQDAAAPASARTAAMEHLGRCGARAASAVPALIAVVQQEKFAKIGMIRHHTFASEAVVALGRIGPEAKEAIPLLIANLGKDFANPNWENRTTKYIPGRENPVALALARIGPAALPELRKAARDSQDVDQRRAAVIALGFLGPAAREAVPELEALQKQLEQDDESSQRDRFLARAVEKALANIARSDATLPKDVAD